MQKPEVAVLPVAGLSTRNLPATKAIHKGFLTLNNLPIIQYAVNSCVEAGIKEIILIYSDDLSKELYTNYFTKNTSLEQKLLEKNKQDLLASLKQTNPEGVKFSFAEQSEPKGNGHAVLCAKDLIGNRDFIVMWVDDVYLSKDKGIIDQLLDVYTTHGGIVENIMKFPKEEITRYSVLTGVTQEGNIVKAKGLIEKPKLEEVESEFASMGPYILPNKILDILPTVTKGTNGEINLTDAINQAVQSGVEFRGVLTDTERYDCGTNEALLKANIQLALKTDKNLINSCHIDQLIKEV